MRRLLGGERELSSVIVRSLQATFSGNEFFLDSTDAETYDLYWRHAGGPSDEEVQDFLSRRWGQFTFTCGESEGREFAGQTGGVRGGGSSSPSIPPPAQGNFNLSTPEGISQAAALIASLKPKSSTVKNCRQCKSANRRSARHCTKCGCCFPSCVVCSRVLQEADQFCPGCGMPRCSYAK